MGMLHSKTFRKNLYKWLFLYILTLFAVTIVVTYSKYISEKAIDDNARVAKFILKVTSGDTCSTTSPDLCNLDSYKPYDTVEYRFSIDTSELEVKTLLAINVDVKDSFKIVGFKDIDNNKDLAVNDSSIVNTLYTGDNLKITYDPSNEVKIVDEVEPSQTTSRNYSIKIKLKNANYKTSYEFEDNVSIGYSMKQITD